MKKLQLLLILIGFSFSLSAQMLDSLDVEERILDKPEGPVWQEFSSYTGRFQVRVPGEMTAAVDSIETPLGKLAYHTFYYQDDRASTENVFYMVSYCDYPEGSMHSDSTAMLQVFFQETMDAAAFSINGDVLYSSDIEYKNYPGKLWRINYLNDQAIIKTKAFMVEHRYYTIQTVTYKELGLNRSGDWFFDSFRIL